jgi:hypothetical protein
MFAVFLILGLGITGAGALFTLGWFLPQWGGGREPVGTLVFGLFLTALGVALIFYAGAWT